MSNYVKTTNFTAKDALASGNPSKLIRGSEHDTEYSNIATAIATKEDAANKGAASGYAGLDASSRIAVTVMPALTGDVTSSAGAVATTIASDVVTNTKLANMAQNTIKGRITASTGDPEDLTASNVLTIINLAAIGTLADARVASSNVTQHQAALALTTSQITSGTFADARIASSNVTQHQAALAIGVTQITQYTSATFTATLTGVSGAPTVTAYYTRVGNMVVLHLPAVTGTSNASTMGISGLPGAITPTRTQWCGFAHSLTDSGSSVVSNNLNVAVNSSGTVSFGINLDLNAWTPTGTKGISSTGLTVSYLLN